MDSLQTPYLGAPIPPRPTPPIRYRALAHYMQSANLIPTYSILHHKTSRILYSNYLQHTTSMFFNSLSLHGIVFAECNDNAKPHTTSTTFCPFWAFILTSWVHYLEMAYLLHSASPIPPTFPYHGADPSSQAT